MAVRSIVLVVPSGPLDQELPGAGPIDGQLVVADAVVVTRHGDVPRLTERLGDETGKALAIVQRPLLKIRDLVVALDSKEPTTGTLDVHARLVDQRVGRAEQERGDAVLRVDT